MVSMSLVFASILMLVAAVTSNPGAQETFVLKPGAEAFIGPAGGDALRLESVMGDEAVVLVRPASQDCAFRIQLRIGQSVPLRSASSMFCEAELQSIVTGGEASFAITCVDQANRTARELKCPEARGRKQQP